MLAERTRRIAFPAVFGLLAGLCVVPLWVTRILPMQDYPQILVFARAWGDCHDPASPFSGTYTTGFVLSPLLLPILLLRALAWPLGFEAAGRIVWTLYAVGLPLASLGLLSALGRERWAVLAVFPLVVSSYWVAGGFFGFATAAPLYVLGLTCVVRWLDQPTTRRGAELSAVMIALHLWHALVFAQLMLDFVVLWLLRDRARDRRSRVPWPALPPIAVFAIWFVASIATRPPASHPPVWPPFLDNATHLLEFVGPSAPVLVALGLLLSVATILGRRDPGPSLSSPIFRVGSPFGLLAAVGVVAYLVLPSTCFGVEGVGNRQPWMAALLVVFAWRPPARGIARPAILAALGLAGAAMLVQEIRSYAAFGRESAGASRLIDRLGPGETLLAPIPGGASVTRPGKPFIALEQYASIRDGSLPNSSFAGYGSSIVRYVDRNPMPGLVGRTWLHAPDLVRFDYVLVRTSMHAAADATGRLRLTGVDGDWVLYEVCGSRHRPTC